MYLEGAAIVLIVFISMIFAMFLFGEDSYYHDSLWVRVKKSDRRSDPRVILSLGFFLLLSLPFLIVISPFHLVYLIFKWIANPLLKQD